MLLAARPVYTSMQIVSCGFFGGPMACAIMMRSNFLAFGEPERAKKALFYGAIFAIIVLIAAFFLPNETPHAFLPVIYTVIFRVIAKRYHMEKSELTLRGFNLRSNWRVAGISLMWLALSCVAIFAFLLTSASLHQSHS